MLNEKDIEILNKLEDKEIDNYFFRNVKRIDFFHALKDKGYFSHKKAPSIVHSKDKNMINIQFWNVLSYLERISLQIKLDKNQEYATELLEIINNITRSKKDNPTTWEYFIKIICNIPLELLIEYLNKHRIKLGVNWIKKWINTRYGRFSIDHDITVKLIPKFLDNKYSNILEDILKAITEIQYVPAKKSIIEFDKEKMEAKLVCDAHTLLDCFKNYKDKFVEICSNDLIFDLADKLKEILKHEQNHSSSDILEVNGKFYKMEATRTKDNESALKDYDFKLKVGEIKKEDIEKAGNDIFKQTSMVSNTIFEFAVRNCKNADEFVNKAKDELGKSNRPIDLTKYRDGDKNIEFVLKNHLYENLIADYSYIWFKSLATNPYVGDKEARVVMTIILRDVLLARCQNKPDDVRNILSRFMSDEFPFPLFRRMFLYIAGENWGNYKDNFWELIEKDPYIYFERIYYEVELYNLLKNNGQKIQDKNFYDLFKIIQNGPILYKPKEEPEQFIAHWQQKWLEVIQQVPQVKDLIKEKQKITGLKEIEPPSEESEEDVEGGVGPCRSSLSKEDFLKKNNYEIVKYLNEFREEKGIYHHPTYEGLSNTLSSAVKEDPNKFVNDLTPFLELNCEAHYLYIQDLLDGVRQAWGEKNAEKKFDWEKLFVFIEKYITKLDLKKVEKTEWLAEPLWVVSVVADLIQDGTRDDAWAFPETHFSSAEKIIDIILRKLKELKKEVDYGHYEPVTRALNTPYGQTIEALILLSLREKRTAKLESWNSKRYEGLLNDGIVEAYTLFGRYISNLLYLDNKWVEKIIKKFEGLDIDIKWQSFMEGYLSSGSANPKLYEIMRTHYEKVLNNDIKFSNEHTKERYVQHISIGYLRGSESLEKNSLFGKMIYRYKYDELSTSIFLFSSDSEYFLKKVDDAKEMNFKEKAISRIFEFWQWTFENKKEIEKNLKSDYPKFLSVLSLLIEFVEIIDEEKYKWIMESAPYVYEDNRDDEFIKNIRRLVENEAKVENVRMLSAIYKAMLSDEYFQSVYIHEEEDIIAIVKKLYEFKRDREVKENADDICNKYGEGGFEFLRNLWEDNNK